METTGALLANEGVNGAEKLIGQPSTPGAGQFSSTEAYQLTSQHGHSTHQVRQVLDFLLAEMENRVGNPRLSFWQAVPKKMEKFFEHNG